MIVRSGMTTLEKYIEKIYNYGYTIVVYIQKDKPGCKEKDRWH
mgnify:CR=1 FL=1